MGEKPWENLEPKDLPAKPSKKPSWVSPSQPSGDLPEEEVSRGSAHSSMMRPELSSSHSSKMSSETQSPTLSMPRERQSLHWTSSTLSRDKAEPYMVSVDEHELILLFEWTCHFLYLHLILNLLNL